MRSLRQLSIVLSVTMFALSACKQDAGPEQETRPQGQMTPEQEAAAGAQEGVRSKSTGSRGAGESIETASSFRVAGVKARLDRHLRRHALKSPENTWALIHALLVYPPETKLPDHDVTILEAILSKATTVEVGGRVLPTFSGAAPDGTPREPHHNQVVMVLLGAGVDPDESFEVDGRRFKVIDLLESALWRFEEPNGDAWEHESWTLSAIARSEPHREAGSFRNQAGERFDTLDLVRRSIARLNEDLAFIEEARRTNQPLEKKREGVHSHPCGGMHLAAVPAHWLVEPKVRDMLPSIRQAVSTLEWRVAAEAEVYEDIRAANPSHNILISAQEMKFYGHWLETMAELRDAGLEIDPEPIQQGILFLVEAVERLDRIGTFQRMDEVRIRRVQTYRDLIGDSAHALRGLRLWTE